LRPPLKIGTPGVKKEGKGGLSHQIKASKKTATKVGKVAKRECRRWLDPGLVPRLICGLTKVGIREKEKKGMYRRRLS